MKETKICVIGLGYVGLPLARLFSTKYKTVGFDMNAKRCEALMAGHDATLEVSDEMLQDAINHHGLVCTSDIEAIRDCNFYVVAVPTPVDQNNNPDLTPLYGASTTVGKVISKGDVVVYESTVYPGVTEDECIPVVEKVSGMKMNEDFFAGYSPERINPGDKQHTVEHIKKVTSGSTPEIGKYVNEVYSSVITAGTHLAPTIKVAEAAKVIENSQRDINIAFVNELSHIFTKMGIDTLDVLEAAGTKWNFLPFRPGLVGGHCIGVDPYYLAQCAQRHGHNPEIILAGRRMNDENFPWASAREYSTIDNIPEYVLANNHGDCGQVTLLFLTLCRSIGIPGHFQSGFMLHPGDENLHDWGEIYIQDLGWVPVDMSFGIPAYAQNEKETYFFLGGIDSFRMVVNNDFGCPLYPAKQYPRSETVDFQRGEVEWQGGNLYFDKWKWNIEVLERTDL